jgi:hypothetical protein
MMLRLMRNRVIPIWLARRVASDRDFHFNDVAEYWTTVKAQHNSKVTSSNKMIRHDYSRVDPKRRANIGHKKKQFATAEWQQQSYEHRLNFYVVPPTAEITLEEFETWAINRLKGKCA